MKERSIEKAKWQRTRVSNLLKNRDSGKYYFRASISRNGKRREVWKSLKTTVLTVAKLRLIDEQAKLEHQRQTQSALEGRDISLWQLSRIYEKRVMANADLAPKSKEARMDAVRRLFKTWPGLSSLPVGDVTAEDCDRWANAFKDDAAGIAQPKKGKKPGASTLNTTIDCLRRLFEIAVDNGLIYRNPGAGLTKMKPQRKHLRLPTGKQFRQLVAHIKKNHSAPGAAETVAVLGFSGMRLGEGMAVRWSDVDFVRGVLHVPGTKSNLSMRTIPLFPPLRAQLERMEASKHPKPADSILTVRDCQKSLDKATAAVGLSRMVHHDLRHFFISSCIEAGIDFLTISRWVGHADGGV